MPSDTIVLVASAYDQADILSDFIAWHLHLGVDFVLVQDCGSTDGSQAVLDRFAADARVRWFTLPERDMRKYASDVVLATLARERYDAEWIIQCDPDEFLCPGDRDLRTLLRDAKRDDLTVLNVPCFNMTGPLPQPGQRATQTLTLRIDRLVYETLEQQLSGNLPMPFIFIRHPPKTIVRAAALVNYGAGTHAAKSAWGQSGVVPWMHFLHFPVRGFDKLEQKVSNTAAWLADNPHLEPWWGWHWRRWIRLNQQGRLREDYERQFVSPARAEELVRNGTCSVDETIARFLKTRAGEGGAAGGEGGIRTLDTM